MRRIALAAALAAVVAVGGTRAAAPAPMDSHTEAAMELLNITMADEQVASMAEPLVTMFGGPNMDPKKAARLRAAAHDQMMKAMPAYRRALAPFYAGAMSEKELRDTVAYLKQPVYARYQAQAPAMMGEAMPEFMKLMMGMIGQVMKEGSRAKLGEKPHMPTLPVLPPPQPMDSHMKAALDFAGTILKAGMQSEQMQKLLSGQGPDGKQMPEGFAQMMQTMMADYKVILAKACYDHYSEADLRAFKNFFNAPIYVNMMTKVQTAMLHVGPEAKNELMKATLQAMTPIIQGMQQGTSTP
jgi:hypothetical protein